MYGRIGRITAELGQREACDEANARLEGTGAGTTVVICEELVADIWKVLKADIPTEGERGEAVFDAMAFVLAHEASHAIIDQLAVAVSGEVEVAADQLATYLFLGRPTLVYRAAQYWRGTGGVGGTERPGDGGRSAFAEAHALEGARADALLCGVYGVDPDARSWILDRGWLSPSRAESCPGATKTLRDFWRRHLDDSPATGRRGLVRADGGSAQRTPGRRSEATGSARPGRTEEGTLRRASREVRSVAPVETPVPSLDRLTGCSPEARIP